MTRLARDLWSEEDGGLSFEWALVLTLLAIGVVAGLSAARDAITDELGDAAQAMLALDGSFSISHPLRIIIDPQSEGDPINVGGGSDSAFTDRADFSDSGRGGPAGQGAQQDNDS